MVVVSGSWVKNVAPSYPTPDIDEMVIPTEPEPNNSMAAKAVLICHANSHPFQDRTLVLEPAKPVKVGRSVARAKATLTNAIFDCKVLSRHHALLWFEKEKFFLQDTKSSNGTFVNNNKLVPDVEHYEIRSGDIVQFGVDVVENNRKVTHGCIIATLRLYLPDGKEVKPTRSEVAPLDELYKLNQIIQEATQREQCLETKLTALQQLVDETRLSVNDTWQAYVGEERLLSRVAALESQLLQATQKAGDDKFREEVRKLQEENTAYQSAAKEALEKLHAERLEALTAASEQQRARISAQQEALLARDQLMQTQQEVEEIAQRYVEEQKKCEEISQILKKREHELLTNLNETKELQAKLKMCQFLGGSLFSNPDEQKYNDVEAKESFIAENEKADSEINGVEPQQNHINLTVSPVSNIENNNNGDESEATETDSICSDGDWNERDSSSAPGTLMSQNTICNETETLEGNKHVSFKLPSEEQDEENDNVQQKTSFNESVPELDDREKQDDDESDAIDSKTLKYQFQSAQKELQKKIDVLEIIIGTNKSKIADLERELSSERALSSERLDDNTHLKEELLAIEQKLKESHNEGVQLRNKVASLTDELGEMMQAMAQYSNNKDKDSDADRQGKAGDRDQRKDAQEKQVDSSDVAPAVAATSSPPGSDSVVSYEQLVGLEEECVLLKERFAQLTEERMKLQRDLARAREQYDRVCNRSYNTMFFYVAPLVLIIVYLLISAVVS